MDTDILTKLVIGIFALFLIGILLGYFVNSGSPSILNLTSGLNRSEVSVINNALSIGNSLNVTVFSPVSTSGTFGIVGLAINALELPINLAGKLMSLGLAIALFLISAIGFFGYILFMFIPSLLGTLLNGLGIFSPLFLILDALVYVIIIGYAIIMFIGLFGKK